LPKAELRNEAEKQPAPNSANHNFSAQRESPMGAGHCAAENAGAARLIKYDSRIILRAFCYSSENGLHPFIDRNECTYFDFLVEL
jgi:hypothetical protein